jgi:hypothetical protein
MMEAMTQIARAEPAMRDDQDRIDDDGEAVDAVHAAGRRKIFSMSLETNWQSRSPHTTPSDGPMSPIRNPW